jgi:hypothetical protein
LRVFDSRQDAVRQAKMVDQAIALRVDGIIIQHGPTDPLKAAAQRALDAGIHGQQSVSSWSSPTAGRADEQGMTVAWGNLRVEVVDVTQPGSNFSAESAMRC